MEYETTRPPDIGALGDLGTVLSVWAHPDDETYLAGGLMAALRDAGQRVVCVTATRGESAEPGADEARRETLAQVRTEELAAALHRLGIKEHHWLDLPDGGCAGVEPEPVVGRIADLLTEVRPDTVLTFGPDGFTGHPDHQAVGRWTAQAVRRVAAGARLLHAVAQDPAVDAALDEQLGVFELGPPRVCTDDELALRLELEGEALDRKVEALVLQRSQTSGIVEEVGLQRFARWVAVETWAPPRVGG